MYGEKVESREWRSRRYLPLIGQHMCSSEVTVSGLTAGGSVVNPCGIHSPSGLRRYAKPMSYTAGLTAHC